jgi:hypothetical protein
MYVVTDRGGHYPSCWFVQVKIGSQAIAGSPRLKVESVATATLSTSAQLHRLPEFLILNWLNTTVEPAAIRRVDWNINSFWKGF